MKTLKLSLANKKICQCVKKLKLIVINTMDDTIKKPLRMLVLNEDPSDAELVIECLHKDGFNLESKRVETKETFLASLAEPYDLILSNDVLPEFDAFQALQLLQERRLDIPFIVLSKAVSEEKW